MTRGESRYSIVKARPKDLTKSALTVSTVVISFGSKARLVSPLYTRNTRPRGLSSVFEVVLTTGRTAFGLAGFLRVEAVSAYDIIPGSSSNMLECCWWMPDPAKPPWPDLGSEAVFMAII